jgi:hypothetical protein
VALAAAGCGGLSGTGTVGELGEGTFSYECELAEGDAACNLVSPDPVNRQIVDTYLGTGGELPAGVAVNGRFDITYFGDVTTDDLERLTVVVEPAASDNVDDRGGFIIRKPGRYAFMARDYSERIVADFTYIEAFDVTDLTIWESEQNVTALSFDMGSATSPLPETKIAAVPLASVDGEDVYLAGALAYEWSSSDETVLAVDPANSTGEPVDGVELNNDEVRIVALGPGSAVLTVKVGELTKDLAVTVNPEVMP